MWLGHIHCQISYKTPTALMNHFPTLSTFTLILTMPMQSCLTILPPPLSTEVATFNPVHNSGFLGAILEMLFLTMSLQCHHIHPISKIHNCYVLNFHLASGIWCILKDLL